MTPAGGFVIVPPFFESPDIRPAINYTEFQGLTNRRRGVPAADAAEWYRVKAVKITGAAPLAIIGKMIDRIGIDPFRAALA